MVDSALSTPVGFPALVEFMENWERFAPEALAAEEPIAELVICCQTCRIPTLLQISSDFCLEIGRWSSDRRNLNGIDS